MTDGWYIRVNGEERGPMSGEAVQEALARGEITLDDWVWRKGLADWVRIGAEPAFAPTLH